MLNSNKIRLIDTLTKYNQRYVTAKELSDILNVTDRTIRNYINDLHDYLLQNGASITSKVGSGYKLIIEDQKLFRNFSIQLSKNNELSNYTGEDRKNFILQEVLLNKIQYTTQDLSRKLFVSESTINLDINDLRKDLLKFDLKLINSKTQGIQIEGSEKDKRQFILKNLYMDKFVQGNIESLVSITSLLNIEKVEDVLNIIMKEVSKYNLRLQEYVYYNLLFHIALSIRRIEDNSQISFDEVVELTDTSTEYTIAKNIIKELEGLFDIKFSDSEANYITLHLKNNNIINSNENNQSKLRYQVEDGLNVLSNVLKIDLTQDDLLIEGLISHLELTFKRFKKGEIIHNPLLNEIKTLNQELFIFTKTIFERIDILKEYELGDDEYGYISLHIMASIERQRNTNKLNVIVVCATGIGSAYMVKARLNNEFKNQLEIVKTVSYFELGKESLENVDLIISTIDLSNYVVSVPVIYVTVFLNNEDIVNIRQYIQVNSLQYDEKKNFQIQQNFLDDYINEETFFPKSNFKTKNQILKDLSNTISQLEGVNLQESLLKQMHLREVFGSVAFSNYVAVPHPLNAITNKPYIVIYTLPEGIYWDDQHPGIQMVVFISPDRFGDNQVSLMSEMLIEIIDDQDLIERLVESNNVDEFKNIFLKHIKGER